MSVVPTLVGNRFQLDHVLGQDSVSVLWSAHDVQLDQPVTVRMMTPSALGDRAALRRLDDDARTVAGLMHPNIVAVRAAGADGGHTYQVLDPIEGQALGAVLATGPLPPGRAVDIAAQVCRALAAAHAAGVFHRDLGPDNVLVDPDGTVKVTGFGISHLSSDAPADPRTDLYAVGWLLYAMLLGGPPPFDDPAVAPILRGQRPGIPRELAGLVAALLAANPTDPARPTDPDDRAGPAGESGPAVTAGDVSRQLAALTRQMAPPPTTGRARHSRAVTRWRSGWRPAVLAGVALVASIATLTAVLRPGEGGDPVVASPETTGPPSIIEPVPEPEPTGTASASAPPTPSKTRGSVAADLLASLRSRLTELEQDGQLDSHTAREIDRRLAGAAQALSANQPETAWASLQATADRVMKLHDQGKIGDSAYDALKGGFARLAESLSAG